MGIIEDYWIRHAIFYAYSAHQILEHEINHNIGKALCSLQIDGKRKLKKSLNKLFASLKMQDLGIDIVIKNTYIELSIDAVLIHIYISGQILSADFYSKRDLFLVPIQKLDTLNLK